MIRPRVVKVTGGDRAALVAAASRACEQQTQAPRCERVLVVYEQNAANLYVETTPPLQPRRAASR